MNDDSGSATRKLWNGNKTQAKLEVSIYGREDLIHIGKDVLRVIGAPSHVCLMINRRMDSFLVMPCEAKDPMAFKVPDNIMLDRNKQMRVSSQSFVSGLLSVNGMEFEHTYQIEGVYSEKNNVVIFKMSDYRIFGEKQEADSEKL